MNLRSQNCLSVFKILSKMKNLKQLYLNLESNLLDSNITEELT